MIAVAVFESSRDNILTKVGIGCKLTKGKCEVTRGYKVNGFWEQFGMRLQ
jgi:hypothetical protein